MRANFAAAFRDSTKSNVFAVCRRGKERQRRRNRLQTEIKLRAREREREKERERARAHTPREKSSVAVRRVFCKWSAPREYDCIPLTLNVARLIVMRASR
jgi:hypothetical protein